MRWLLKQLTDRESGWWRLYEALTPLVGCFALIAMFLIIWNAVAANNEWPTVFDGHETLLFSIATTCILLVWKGDLIKYRITKDARDEPNRKWASFKHAGKYLSNEVVFLQGNNLVPNRPVTAQLIKHLNVTNCPKCGVTHAFSLEKTTPQTCVFYGCGATLPRPENTT